MCCSCTEFGNNLVFLLILFHFLMLFTFPLAALLAIACAQAQSAVRVLKHRCTWMVIMEYLNFPRRRRHRRCVVQSYLFGANSAFWLLIKFFLYEFILFDAVFLPKKVIVVLHLGRVRTGQKGEPKERVWQQSENVDGNWTDIIPNSYNWQQLWHQSKVIKFLANKNVRTRHSPPRPHSIIVWMRKSFSCFVIVI